jgi:hypothetical protein
MLPRLREISFAVRFEQQGEGRARVGGPARVLDQLGWHLGAFDNRVTPVIEVYAFGQMLRAQPVRHAGDWIDS